MSEQVNPAKDITLSVIVPCYNNSDTLAEQLEALSKESFAEPWEVILADNGSKDRSLAVAETFRDTLANFRIVHATEKQGAAHARNVGAKAAKGDLLAFCDADDVIAPGWLTAIATALTSHDFVASRHDFTHLNSPLVLKGRKNSQSEGLQTYKYPNFLSHAGGSGLGVKRRVHEAVGGFDEEMLRLQDTDYCWRVQLAGHELHFVKEAGVYVRFRQTAQASYKQALKFGEYNVLLYKKYRDRGMSKLSWKRGVLAWMILLRNTPQIFKRETRSQWLRQLAWRLGRLQGCIKYRVMAL